MMSSVLARAQMVNRPDPTGGASGAARGNHVIRGKIFLPSGRLPEVRLRVVLELVSGGIYAETFSDSVGGFEFRSLANNTYRIVVPSDGQGYESAQENMEVSGTTSRTYTTQLYLREKEREQRTSMNKLVSAAAFSQDVPKAAKKSYEQGLKKLKDGKEPEALALFQDALKQFPDYVLALNKVGELQMGQQQSKEAEASFRRAVEISPKHPHSLINLGMLLVQLQRYVEAVEPLEAALTLDESFPLAHLNLGVALLERTPKEEKDLERAERAFRKALAMGGTPLAYVHKYLFNLYVRRQDYAKAAMELEAYLKDAPAAPDTPQVQEMIEKVKKAATQPAKPNGF
jgi:Tfp pilus assembly protein PilF